MKAIQIRYLGPTNTKGARLKAWTHAGPIIEGCDSSLNVDEQARRLASRYIAEKGWSAKITGFGTLPNEDFVATIS